MASKGVLMTAFFDQFLSFLTELKDMYPDDPDFSMFLTTLRMLKSSNPSMVIKYVNDSLGNFEEKIALKDEEFFMKYEFSEFSDSVDMNLFSKLKGLIALMTPQSKDNVWKYIHNISRLAKACQ